MTNQEILEIALQQSAIDLNCGPEDFFCGAPKIVYSQPHPKARKYLKLPFDCNLVFYGGNIVASVNDKTEPLVRAYLEKHAPHPYRCYDTPEIHELGEAVAPLGLWTRHMAEYFLPDVTVLRELPCAYPMKVLEAKDFSELYLPEWSNALCEDRKHLDVLGVGAYDSDRLIGLAGCSADCESMWQIGIDVLPEYRRKGVAAALTSRLALEILSRGKVPFYCAAWSNIASVRNAIHSGFRPAWVELTVKPVSESK